MMKLISQAVLSIAFLSLPALAQVISGPQATIQPKQQTIVLGQPLVLNLEIRSDVDARVDLGANLRANISVQVTEPSGTSELKTFSIPSFTVPGVINLKAGENYKTRVNVTDAYRPAQTGTYKIQIVTSEDSGLNEASQPLVATVVVTESDPQKLAAACTDLGALIRASASASERLELAAELITIHDPVVVSVIKEILNRGLGVDDLLIKGLGAVQDARAVELLGAVALGTDPVSVLVARSSLYKIEGTATDPAVRAHAARALMTSEGHLGGI